MEEKSAFVVQMEGLLRSKEENLDRVELKALKDDFKLFQTAFQGVYNVLYKKGIIHDDPYKYETKLSEVGIPPESPFPESEKIDQMSIRLSQFDMHLDFLNNYCQFSVESLTMGRIKRLIALVKYFDFTSFTSTSQHVNTRCFTELVDCVRKGTDQLSTGIINESLSMLDNATRSIFLVLKSLTLFHKERYKLDVRSLILPVIEINPELAITHKADVVRKIRFKFAELANEHPFYPELVEEILLEDYSSDGLKIKDDIVARLTIKEDTRKKDAARGRDFRTIIMDGIRVMTGTGFHLSEAVRKLQNNSDVLQNRDRGFMANMRKMLARMFNAREPEIEYDLDYLDPITIEHKEERIRFTSFCAEVMKRAQLFSTMTGRNSTAYGRISSAPEEQAFKFLEKSIEEVDKFHRKLYALDEFFKNSEMQNDERARITGIRLELETIKNTLIRAKQKKHEYVAEKEEIEQMKRLGIRSDV
ncbi:MAG: hypothetical protein NT080_05065 [Spirochaetes bacterium]|nr:hypothetical protein [Spirochaetota bacterium]